MFVVFQNVQNPTCIQYFCCCSYVCAAMSLIPLITMIVTLSKGDQHILATFIISAVLFLVYLRAGHLSRQLQAQPYFSNSRLAPRSSMHLAQTVECHTQPIAHVEMATMVPSQHVRGDRVSYDAAMAECGDVPVVMATAVAVQPLRSSESYVVASTRNSY